MRGNRIKFSDNDANYYLRQLSNKLIGDNYDYILNKNFTPSTKKEISENDLPPDVKQKFQNN
jgi:hypothetical protein